MRKMRGEVHAGTTLMERSVAVAQAQLGWTGTTTPDLASRILAQVGSRWPGELDAARFAFGGRGILP